jgi:hypothetical protein
MGPILDIVLVSLVVIAGAMCVESGRRVNLGLLCLVRFHCFAFLVVTP